jgi:hypothetical protein
MNGFIGYQNPNSYFSRIIGDLIFGNDISCISNPKKLNL